MKSFVLRPMERWIVLVVAAIVLIILPLLNCYAPGSFISPSDFTINLYGKFLTLAVLALAIDFLWGFTGLLCLGQCLFFALGAYAMGMHLILMIGKLGQYKSDLPDFMVFLGYPTLPLHWIPFYSLPFALFAAVAVPGLLAFLFGYLAFRSRIRGVYFSILTQALTYAACLMFFRNDFTFGGNNGLTDFKTLVGIDINSPLMRRTLFIISGLLLLGTYLVFRWLTTTKFGLIQRAIRDSENRVLFLGYSATSYKLFVFTLSAIISGMAGALYVGQVGIINPSEMETTKSLEAVMWVAIGGRGTLWGAILGAIFVCALKSYATRFFPEMWLFLMGGLFVLAVLFLPKGIAGVISSFPGWLACLKSSRKNEGDSGTPGTREKERKAA